MRTWLTQRAWRTWLGGAAIVVGAILVVALIQVVYKVWVFDTFPKMDTRGQFGDLFGAVTAFFTGLAFAGVIYTIILQRKELEMQRKELQSSTEQLRRAAEAQTDQAELQLEQARLLQVANKVRLLTALGDVYARQRDIMERGGFRTRLWEAEHEIREWAKERFPQLSDEEAMDRVMKTDDRYPKAYPELFRTSFEEWQRSRRGLDRLTSELAGLSEEIEELMEQQREVLPDST